VKTATITIIFFIKFTCESHVLDKKDEPVEKPYGLRYDKIVKPYRTTRGLSLHIPVYQ
jgi:hypothetical protein